MRIVPWIISLPSMTEKLCEAMSPFISSTLNSKYLSKIDDFVTSPDGFSPRFP